MRLLIFTQTVDSRDPSLGFFHGWIKSLAPSFEKVIVVCLRAGAHDLPHNCEVLSLGKETRPSRVRYIFRFFLYIVKKRNDYDAVFAHMNQEYVLLGGLFWLLVGKKVVLWYNHTNGSLLTRCAGILAHAVCYVSPHAYTARFKNAVQMPAGIDFSSLSSGEREEDTRLLRILSLGRISPVKRLETLIDAAGMLAAQDVRFALDIYGDTAESARDRAYYGALRKRAAPLETKGYIHFYGGVPNSEVGRLYVSHDAFVNLTQTGSFDKTVIEAMHCGALAFVSNRSFEDLIPAPFRFREGSAADLFEKLKNTSGLSEDDRKQWRTVFIQNSKAHGLEATTRKLVSLLRK